MNIHTVAFLAVATLSLSACGGGSGPDLPPIPQLAAAQGAALSGCASLAGFQFANTVITDASAVAAATLSVAGKPIGEHCRVTGRMNDRTGPVDGQAYAIRFEMRLPNSWNGRFLHQGNGGIDGVVAAATGSAGAGQTNGLHLGFAVLSSDAGHTNEQNPLFGIDPQARLNYGYAAVGTLTPMAKALIAAAYGKGPGRSYFAGSSNGGRHAMVAASRYAAEYDGILAQSPGFNLPKAAGAQLWGAQQWAKVATDPANLETAFNVGERRLVADAILARCDALDGVADGMVNSSQACKTAFDIQRDVPTCPGARDGTCLSTGQKTAYAAVFGGPINTAGQRLYATWPFDPGLVSSNWAGWKFRNSVGSNRDPVASVLFASPPEPGKLADTLAYALSFSLDTDFPKFSATSGVYTESAMSFMTPSNPGNLDTLRNRGAKMIIVHGESDGVFSPDDTAAYMDVLAARYASGLTNFVRFFRVPGMNHSGGGPSTDQYDGLNVLINWVERGEAPDRIIAQARGVGNPGGVNVDVPVSWAPNRTRPLCPYPLVARYKGGDVEAASSFVCEKQSP